MYACVFIPLNPYIPGFIRKYTLLHRHSYDIWLVNGFRAKRDNAVITLSMRFVAAVIAILAVAPNSVEIGCPINSVGKKALNQNIFITGLCLCCGCLWSY